MEYWTSIPYSWAGGDGGLLNPLLIMQWQALTEHKDKKHESRKQATSGRTMTDDMTSPKLAKNDSRSYQVLKKGIANISDKTKACT